MDRRHSRSWRGPHRRRKGAHRKTSPKRNNDSFSFRDLLIWCVVPFVAVLLVRIFLIGFYVIPSGSMRDTIEIGDRVITSKLTPKYFDLKRGDIVVFHDPANWLNQETTRGKGDYLIKRLIGVIHQIRRRPEQFLVPRRGDRRAYFRHGG